MVSNGQETLTVVEHFVPNNDGWLLHLKQVFAPARLRKDLRPFLIVPGYGMNSFAFSYHPSGQSMDRVFAEAGYEFWTADLRWQGESRPNKKRPRQPTLRDLASTDLPAAIDHILASTRTDHRTITLAGCSLGGTIAYSYLALTQDTLVSAVIGMCTPLRWVAVPTFLRVAMASPRLLRHLPIRGSAAMARYGLPIAGRVPFAINVYANPANITLSDAAVFSKSISNPSPSLNAEIAQWIKDGDLRIRGVNISEAMGDQTLPLLVVSANRDGIVPPPTARFVRTIWGGEDVEELIVGDDVTWYSHADAFIGKHARRDLFEPVIRWLQARETTPPPTQKLRPAHPHNDPSLV